MRLVARWSITVLLSSLAAHAIAQIPSASVKLLEAKLFAEGNPMSHLRLPDIVHHLAIDEGSRVADIGCGKGEMSVLLGHLVGPGGQVFAEDVSQRSLDQTVAWAGREGLKNVEFVLGKTADPNLPLANLDAVIAMNAYHEFESPSAILSGISSSLKAGGRLVIVDNQPYRIDTTREEQQTEHVLAPKYVVSDLEAAGFRVIERDNAFAYSERSKTTHWLIVAER